MTLCGMETAHKFLAFKGAFTSNYKAQNFITAAHFARLVTDLENSGVSQSSCPNPFVNYSDLEKRHRRQVQEELLDLLSEGL